MTVDGEVVTAEENILHGHMRELIIDACEKLAIPVRREAPSLHNAATWKEAFLSSRLTH